MHREGQSPVQLIPYNGLLRDLRAIRFQAEVSNTILYSLDSLEILEE